MNRVIFGNRVISPLKVGVFIEERNELFVSVSICPRMADEEAVVRNCWHCLILLFYIKEPTFILRRAFNTNPINLALLMDICILSVSACRTHQKRLIDRVYESKTIKQKRDASRK
jgi:hypothetical protein